MRFQVLTSSGPPLVYFLVLLVEMHALYGLMSSSLNQEGTSMTNTLLGCVCSALKAFCSALRLPSQLCKLQKPCLLMNPIVNAGLEVGGFP